MVFKNLDIMKNNNNKVQTWQLICTTLLGTVQLKSEGGTLIHSKKKKKEAHNHSVLRSCAQM